MANGWSLDCGRDRRYVVLIVWPATPGSVAIAVWPGQSGVLVVLIDGDSRKQTVLILHDSIPPLSEDEMATAIREETNRAKRLEALVEPFHILLFNIDSRIDICFIFLSASILN